MRRRWIIRAAQPVQRLQRQVHVCPRSGGGGRRPGPARPAPPPGPGPRPAAAAPRAPPPRRSRRRPGGRPSPAKKRFATRHVLHPRSPPGRAADQLQAGVVPPQPNQAGKCRTAGVRRPNAAADRSKWRAGPCRHTSRRRRGASAPGGPASDRPSAAAARRHQPLVRPHPRPRRPATPSNGSHPHAWVASTTTSASCAGRRPRSRLRGDGPVGAPHQAERHQAGGRPSIASRRPANGTASTRTPRSRLHQP